MWKHWRLAHPDLEEQPKFRINIVGKFQDAMSRQLSESIRIELRGEKVLNSKSEYSRSRIPRLVVEKDDLELNAEKKRKVEEKEKAEKDRREQEARILEDGLNTGGAAWDLSVKAGAKKRSPEPQPQPQRRKSKKRKMEKLVGWGEEGEEEEDSGIRSWLMGKEQTPDTPSAEGGGQTINPCIVDIGSQTPQAGPNRLKQLELSFRKEVEHKYAST